MAEKLRNRCGRRHLGRCCINCERPDGSRGLTCTHCGQAITPDEREQINRSFQVVAEIIRAAGGEI